MLNLLYEHHFVNLWVFHAVQQTVKNFKHPSCKENSYEGWAKWKPPSWVLNLWYFLWLWLGYHICTWQYCRWQYENNKKSFAPKQLAANMCFLKICQLGHNGEQSSNRHLCSLSFMIFGFSYNRDAVFIHKFKLQPEMTACKDLIKWVAGSSCS